MDDSVQLIMLFSSGDSNGGSSSFMFTHPLEDLKKKDKNVIPCNCRIWRSYHINTITPGDTSIPLVRS